MRKIVNWLKDAIKIADSLWIRSAGHEVRIFGNPRVPEGTIFYGFYDWPKRSRFLFGIDSPNEITVQVERTVLANVVGDLVGKKVEIEDTTWQIVDYYFIRNSFLGKYRIALVCERFQKVEKDGIQFKCPHGHHMEIKDEPQNGN